MRDLFTRGTYEQEPRGAPKLLTDEQMKSYVMNVREHVCVAFFSSLVRLTQHVVQGYIALPVADMPPEDLLGSLVQVVLVQK